MSKAAAEEGRSRGSLGTAPLLFESKLHPPRLRPALVERDALVERLLRDDTPITSVVAPPGYGKTTVLAQWASRVPSQVAWLSVDRHDNDLSQLFSYTDAALKRSASADATFTRASTRVRSVAAAASQLAATMAALKEPVTLVLDHVEALDNAECLDAVAELALHLPANARLALATRVDPPLPIPRLRAGGQITEIGVVDLAMNSDEASALFEQAGLDLSEADLGKLIERTEGWPVGLYLAALALNAGGSQDAAGIAFSGDDHLVADYLRAELLDKLSSDEVEFLTRTAVLERLNPQLCDAMLATEGSRDVLASLAHSNLLLVPLDRQGEWYRYHHLFRDLLHAELLHREPALAPTLHLKAAQWFEDNGFPELAIEHSQLGGDPDRPNRLLLVHGPAFYATGRRAATRRWMMWFEEQKLLDQYPALATLGVLLFSGTGREWDAERWAAAVEGPSSDPSGERDETVVARTAPDRVLPDGSTLAGWLALLRLCLAREGIEGMLRDAKIAESGIALGSGFRTGVLTFEALAHLYTDDVDGADILFGRATAIGLDTGRVPTVVATTALQGFIAANRRDWECAAKHADSAMAIIEQWELSDYFESGIAYALAARVAHHRGDDNMARGLMTSGARIRPLLNLGRPLVSAATLLEFARNYAELEDAPGAREVIRQARGIVNQRPGLGTLPAQLDAVEAGLGTVRAARVGATSLTAAELRLVPFLPTHLTFPQIADRIGVSRNTTKTQAISIYQKLGVASRGEAVDRLRELHLLDA